MLNLSRLTMCSYPEPIPVAISLGSAYLCADCDMIVVPDRGQCTQCGSRQVMPVEAFLRRVKQQVHMRIEKRHVSETSRGQTE